MVKAPIEVTLDYSLATMSSPAVILEQVKQTTETDSNGYWSVNLVPNANLTPTGTVYTVRTPFRSFQVTVPTSSPAQASANLVNVPVLPGQTTSLAGPVTIATGPVVVTTGDVTVSNGNITGKLSDKGGMVWNAAAYSGSSGDVQFQAANDAASAAGGGTVYGPPKGFTFAASLKLDSGVRLWLDPGCIITRNFIGTGSTVATVINRTQTGGGNTDIQVIGGTFKSNTSQNGRHFGFIQVTRLLIAYSTILSVQGDWNTGFENIYNAVITGLNINSGTLTGNDGIHVRSGRYISISNCSVVSGDDCIALEIGAVNGDAGTALDHLQDVAVTNCTVNSVLARGFIVLRDGAATRELRRIVISNIVGLSNASFAFLVQDTTAGTNGVHDVDISQVEIDCSGSTGAGCVLQNVARIWMDKVNLQSPSGSPFVLTTVTDAWLSACEGTPRAAALQCLLAQTSCVNINLRDCFFTAATQHNVAFNGVTDGSVIACKLTNATDTGLDINNSTGIRVFANRMTGSVVGIRDEGTSDWNVYVGNDVRGNSGNAVIHTGSANTVFRNNPGFNPQGVAAITVTASPFTYTNADHVPEVVYISGGTITTTVKNAITVFGAVTNVSVALEPNEAVVVTYTVAPTMNKDRK